MKFKSVDDREITFLVQGPVFMHEGKNQTLELVNSIKSLFPNSTTIFSTWPSEENLSVNEDFRVISQDPGDFIYNKITLQRNNVNRQIVSTYAGLLATKTRYCVKLRSDLMISNRNISKIISNLPRTTGVFQSFLSQKIAVLNVTSTNPKFHYKLLHHPCDWVYVGTTEDLCRIWDISLMSRQSAEIYSLSGPEGHDNFLPQYRTEAYIWQSFLKKYADFEFTNSYDFSKEKQIISEEMMVNLLIVSNMKSMGVYSTKHNVKIENLTNMYTALDWRRLEFLYSVEDKGPRLGLIDLESLAVGLYRLTVKFKQLSGWIKLRVRRRHRE